MTPQEQDMIGGLIDRVQKTQLAEKDMDAEQMLQQGLGRNPDALYILAQTVLVQKYALEQAQAQLTQAKVQIDQMQQHPEPKHASSFLGSLLGRNDAPAPPPPAPYIAPTAPADPAPAISGADAINMDDSDGNTVVADGDQENGYSYHLSDHGDSYAIVDGPGTKFTFSGDWGGDREAEMEAARKVAKGPLSNVSVNCWSLRLFCHPH